MAAFPLNTGSFFVLTFESCPTPMLPTQVLSQDSLFSAACNALLCRSVKYVEDVMAEIHRTLENTVRTLTPAAGMHPSRAPFFLLSQ